MAARCLRTLTILTALCLARASPCYPQTKESIDIRGHAQTLYVYGAPMGDPVVVSSGDGGWIHLGPAVAEFLAQRGNFVIGFDARAYLASFTSGTSALRIEDEPSDYKILIRRARASSGKPPLLVGVSAGAALSVLAATDTEVKHQVLGVIALGLPARAELAWRLRDALTYLTHKLPDEPLFSTSAIISQVAPLPIAAIHSTHDEFVPVSDVQAVLARALEPKRLVLVPASNHRFSDNLKELYQRLLEAIDWIRQNPLR